MADSMLEKIPAMSDSDLAALFANAQRLSTNGSTKQQIAAKDLLPALESETRQRSEAKSAAVKARNAARVRSKKKPAVEAEEESDSKA